MKRRIPLFISVLLILVLTACTSASEVKIMASDGAAYDQFGYSVSISGDYAIAGARGDDDLGNASGSAYIYKRDGTAWSQQAKITASDGAAYDYFGDSVSISGDYAIVGAGCDDDNGNSSGSAYICKRDGTAWSQQAKITASDGAAYDYFGDSVSISGDYAIVGAIGDDDRGDRSGSAYIFEYNGTAWNEEAKITASDGAMMDLFGYSVSISGDRAIVGSQQDDDSGSRSGSAYIFEYNGTAWNEQAKITASDGEKDDYFGTSVSISGDTIIVGAPHDDGSGSSSGSSYIFAYNGTAWNEEAKITASDGAMMDLFGYSVSISGDYTIVGACGDDDNGGFSGSAYIFEYNGTAWNEQAKITASDGEEDDQFSCMVSISGDYVLVGAHGDANSGKLSGSAYIYDIQTYEPPITGDLNGDDLLTPADAVIVLKMAAGCYEPTTAADVSSDGAINSLDALIILQAATGLITL